MDIQQRHAILTNTSVQLQLRQYWAAEMAKPRNADPKRLLKYGLKVFSQNEEDGIIAEIFRRIGMDNRSFIEFGVENGSECNSAKASPGRLARALDRDGAAACSGDQAQS